MVWREGVEGRGEVDRGRAGGNREWGERWAGAGLRGDRDMVTWPLLVPPLTLALTEDTP